MKVFVAGASGAIGRPLVPRLIAAGHQVTGMTRREQGAAAIRAAGAEAAVCDVFDAEALSAAVTAAGPEIVVHQLTALPAKLDVTKKGVFEATNRIRTEGTRNLVDAARAAGARRMLTISSVGADAGSRSFYLRVKGEMEQALERTGFDRLDILQPGLLRGPRGGERRIGERIGIAVSPLLNLVLRGRLARFAAIDADVVAAAAAECLRRTEAGLFRHDNGSLHALADGM